MDAKNHNPDTVSASLEARLGPYPQLSRAVLEDLDAEASLAVAPSTGRRPRVRLIDDLKLLFRALGAGNSAVPMGDNGRTAYLLAEYARTLQRH